MKNRPFIASFAAVVAACGAFGEPPGAATDGGTNVPDDGGATDSAIDGAIDGAIDAGATPGAVRCKGTPRLEDDFGRKSAAGNGWVLNAGATLAIVGDVGRPPPALTAESPALGDGGVAEHTMTRELDLASGEGSVCIEFDVLIELLAGEFTQDGFAEILAVSPEGAGNLFIEMREPGVLVLTRGGVVAPLVQLAFSAWQHLTLRLPFGSGEVTLDLDDREQLKIPGQVGDPPPSLAMSLGIEAQGRSGTTRAMRALIDNFRVTVAP